MSEESLVCSSSRCIQLTAEMEVLSTENLEGNQVTENILSNGDVPEAKPEENVTSNDKVSEAKAEDCAISEKEKELLDIVFTLESEKQNLLEQSRSKIAQLVKELEESKAENEKLQKKNQQLEQNLKQAVTAGVDVPKSKKELDDVLIRAKTLLFEKTKECKQKEQHIETLKSQVDAIKEVLMVTKEMLNLRSIETEHLQGRLESMAAKGKAEREKSALIEKKLLISQNVYADLKKEYDFQSKVFKELKETYEQKISVLNNTIEKLK